MRNVICPRNGKTDARRIIHFNFVCMVFCNAQYRNYDKVCLLFLKSSDLPCLFLFMFLSDDFI